MNAELEHASLQATPAIIQTLLTPGQLADTKGKEMARFRQPIKPPFNMAWFSSASPVWLSAVYASEYYVENPGELDDLINGILARVAAIGATEILWRTQSTSSKAGVAGTASALRC